MSDDEKAAGQADTAALMYEEALRIRARQESRVDDLRERAVKVLSLVGGGVVVSVGLARDGQVGTGWLRLAAASVVVMVAAGMMVLRSVGGYLEALNIHDIRAKQFEAGTRRTWVLRDLSKYHYDQWSANEDGPIKWMHWALLVELAAAGVAVAAIVLGAAV